MTARKLHQGHELREVEGPPDPGQLPSVRPQRHMQRLSRHSPPAGHAPGQRAALWSARPLTASSWLPRAGLSARLPPLLTSLMQCLCPHLAEHSAAQQKYTHDCKLCRVGLMNKDGRDTATQWCLKLDASSVSLHKHISSRRGYKPHMRPSSASDETKRIITWQG